MKFILPLLALGSAMALQPVPVKLALQQESSASALLAKMTASASAVAKKVEEAAPTSVWYPHHNTTYHAKVPNMGYVKGATEDKTSPYWDPETEIPVSTAMKCIMNMAVQYFVVYTALAVLRTMRQLTNAPPSKMEKTFNAATGTVAFVPMLSCLILGVRMRAVQLSQNQTEKYDLPQPFVKDAMNLCTFAILLQVLLVILVPLVTGKAPETDHDGNVVVQRTADDKGKTFALVATACRFIAMAFLYGGMLVVSIGAFAMKGPEEIWGKEVPPVSPAVFVTMNMCYLYFFIYGMQAILRAMGNPKHGSILGLFNICASCVNLAPMLCVLFIGARMRALQIDPKTGAPQSWAQNCFYLCFWSLFLQCVLTLLIGGCVGGKVVKGEIEGDVIFDDIANPTIFSLISAMRWILLLALYGGLIAVIISILVIQHPKGKEYTPALSPAMINVIDLTVQYFFIYSMLYIFNTLRQFGGANMFRKTLNTLSAARGTVMFCPMLALLFVGLRMRALQLTGGRGAPQGWAQDCMFLCTWSVQFQMILCLCMPCFTGRDVETDEDGNVKTAGTTGWGLYVLEAFRYACMAAMYGGAVGVSAAVFVMTPATANGKGAWVGVPPPVNVQETVADAPVPTVANVTSMFF